MRQIVFILSLLLIINCKNTESKVSTSFTTKDYKDLVSFFKEWRSFETPPSTSDGAPDYTKSTFDKRYTSFQFLVSKLKSIDTTGWPIAQKADYKVVEAEMNGYDFNHRILKPWERDPAFYVTVKTERSDVPAHEGPTHHRTLEVWQYEFPLSEEKKKAFADVLKIIPALNKKATQNLTGNAKELWIAGIRDIKSQSDDLKDILAKQGIQEDKEITSLLNNAIQSTDEFATWLEKESEKKTGPSGLGKENYTWYQQHVHLVPMTWDDEVILLKRDLSRAWSAMKLEEHRNKFLPPLPEVDSPEAYDKLADAAATKLMTFLKEKDIISVQDYFEPALREHLTKYRTKDKRNFFQITTHYDPRPLYSHFYHWFELAIMDRALNKSEIRKGPLLYNIFDTHNEGIATAVEEIFMHAGLYDDSPHSKEIVYIMVAQRAARGLGSLYAHANEMTMEEAGGIHTEYTPRGWMKTEKELRKFEQHLYMRQPGYGTSYITGKYLIDQAMADYARIKENKGEPFTIKEFLDKYNESGNIPVSLTYWEMTGNPGYIKE